MKVLFYLQHEHYRNFLGSLPETMGARVFVHENDPPSRLQFFLEEDLTHAVFLHVWRPDEKALIRKLNKKGVKTFHYEHGTLLFRWDRQKYKANLCGVNSSLHWCQQSVDTYAAINPDNRDKLRVAGVPGYEELRLIKPPPKTVGVFTTHSLCPDLAYQHANAMVDFAAENSDWQVYIQPHPIERFKKVTGVQYRHFHKRDKPSNVIVSTNCIGKVSVAVSPISSVFVPLALSHAKLVVITPNFTEDVNLLYQKTNVTLAPLKYDPEFFVNLKEDSFLDGIGYPDDSVALFMEYLH